MKVEVEHMRVCVPIAADGVVDPRWGRAERLAFADVDNGEIKSWEEQEVNWGQLHEISTEARHHANVARLMRDHLVEAVVADHMGPGMLAMLERMKIRVHLGASGDARKAVVLASLSPA